MMSRWCRGCEKNIPYRYWDDTHDEGRRIYHSSKCMPEHIAKRRARDLKRIASLEVRQ